MQLIDRVRSTIRRYDLVRPGQRVIVALSGGPDSVALACLLRELHAAGELELVGAAHLDHQLRDESPDDAAFCVAVAESLQLPILCDATDVRALAASRGLSMETAAHEARYAFFRTAAERLGADRIALGHTMDDQAETVLLRLLRGAGSRGLAGMYPRRGPYIRPLIQVRRRTLEAFLRERGRTCRLDASNADRSIPRNRVRADLLPLLARDFNPQVVQILGQQAELARDEWDWLSGEAAKLCAAAAIQDSPDLIVEAAPIRQAHPALARAAVRHWLERTAAGRPITWMHVQRALTLFAEGVAGGADFPGQRVERRGHHVVLTSRLSARHRTTETVEQPSNFRYPLAVPGETRIPEAEATLVARVEPAVPALAGTGARGPVTGAGDVALVRFDRLGGGPWAVRGRKPGDRLTWQGLGGRKKVHDLFVDRKVPRDVRDRIPIVVDAEDRVVWVAGHAVAGEFRVTDPAQAVVVLRLKLWGGSA